APASASRAARTATASTPGRVRRKRARTASTPTAARRATTPRRRRPSRRSPEPRRPSPVRSPPRGPPAHSPPTRPSPPRAPAPAGPPAVAVPATDGLPTECDTNIGNVANIAQGAAAGNPAVKTFVIGVFSASEASVAQSNLDKIAGAGGTGKAFVIQTNGN